MDTGTGRRPDDAPSRPLGSEWPRAIAAGWHPIALESEAPSRGRPLARRLLGRPLILFEGRQGPVVLDDRCPHRAMPLSQGRVRDGAAICPYHGWSFAEGGRCLGAPGADRVPQTRARAYPTRVKAGLIWTCLAAAPPAFPDLPDEMEDPALHGFWWPIRPSRARVLDAIENHLDPAHPHFLHAGLVRSPQRRRPVAVTVRSGPWGAMAIYREDARAQGALPRLLEGMRGESIGRYFPPATGQVAFRNARGLVFAVSVTFAPEAPGITRPYAHLCTPRGRAPAWVKAVALKALHWPILRQDRRALKLQSANVARFPDESHARGPLDFLGESIWRLANGDEMVETERQDVAML